MKTIEMKELEGKEIFQCVCGKIVVLSPMFKHNYNVNYQSKFFYRSFQCPFCHCVISQHFQFTLKQDFEKYRKKLFGDLDNENFN